MTGNQCGQSSYTKISRRTSKFQEILRISRSCRHPEWLGYTVEAVDRQYWRACNAYCCHRNYLQRRWRRASLLYSRWNPAPWRRWQYGETSSDLGLALAVAHPRSPPVTASVSDHYGSLPRWLRSVCSPCGDVSCTRRWTSAIINKKNIKLIKTVAISFNAV